MNLINHEWQQLCRTLMKPYSVSATNAMGTVEKNTPAMGIKEQMKTNSESSPMPGIAIAHIPSAVRAVFTAAIRAWMREHADIRADVNVGFKRRQTPYVPDCKRLLPAGLTSTSPSPVGPPSSVYVRRHASGEGLTEQMHALAAVRVKVHADKEATLRRCRRATHGDCQRREPTNLSTPRRLRKMA